MAVYCVQADLTTRFGADEIARITDKSSANPATIDTDVVTAAIADASSVIDSKLLQVYDQPTAPYPQKLVACTCDLARWLMYEDNLDAESIIQRRYEAAIACLEGLLDGSEVMHDLDEKTITATSLTRT